MFSGCTKLNNAALPAKVTTIGNNAFSNCTGLTHIELPENLLLFGMEAFSGCTGLNELTLPDALNSIGLLTFSGCSGLEELDLPDNVMSIGKTAFSDCYKLTKLYSVLGSNTAKALGVADIEFCDKEYLSLYMKYGNDSLTVTRSDSNLTEVIIPEGVTSIGGSAFEKQTALVVREKSAAFSDIDVELAKATQDSDKIDYNKVDELLVKYKAAKNDFEKAQEVLKKWEKRIKFSVCLIQRVLLYP